MDCRVPGIGPVTIYDTAQRIGYRLGLAPDRVYLHAGTREGARKLGLDTSHEYLLPEELPFPLQKLAPADVEDFLCRYKDKFGTDQETIGRRASHRRKTWC